MRYKKFLLFFSFFYSLSFTNLFRYLTDFLSLVFAMERVPSSVFDSRSSAKVFGLHISFVALAGVDLPSLRSLITTLACVVVEEGVWN